MTAAKPFTFEGAVEAKRFAPATQRNAAAIVDVLADVLPARGTVLEIASGTGEHVVHFAAVFPHLNWQPSDFDTAGLASIAAWRAEAGLTNIAAPVQIDASSTGWPIDQADAILCINMIHISPWAATEGLMAGAARHLRRGAPLFLYGPYYETGVKAAPSNSAFDASLKSRNPDWGLREVDVVRALALRHGLSFEARSVMPANNLSLIFLKD
jgi:Protein of unknown function (DUF938)